MARLTVLLIGALLLAAVPASASHNGDRTAQQCPPDYSYNSHTDECHANYGSSNASAEGPSCDSDYWWKVDEYRYSSWNGNDGWYRWWGEEWECYDPANGIDEFWGWLCYQSQKSGSGCSGWTLTARKCWDDEEGGWYDCKGSRASSRSESSSGEQQIDLKPSVPIPEFRAIPYLGTMKEDNVYMWCSSAEAHVFDPTVPQLYTRAPEPLTPEFRFDHHAGAPSESATLESPHLAQYCPDVPTRMGGPQFVSGD